MLPQLIALRFAHRGPAAVAEINLSYEIARASLPKRSVPGRTTDRRSWQCFWVRPQEPVQYTSHGLEL